MQHARFGQVVVVADHRGLRGGAERIGDVGGGPPTQFGPGQVVLVVVERTPQQQISAVRERRIGHVRGVELGRRHHRDLAVLGDPRTLADAVDRRALLRAQQVGAFLSGPAPRLGEYPSPKPYVLGRSAVLPGATVVRAGGPRFPRRPQQRTADRTVRHRRGGSARVQPHRGAGQRCEPGEVRGDIDRAGWSG
ncbi:hypothetical protein ABTZ57_10500 [Streptomyces sp. NPDC094048]|uniref:hypothetical protein n=1 Tax=Streptomyces sp. NPDC094048 TaxID=3155207 RepID=UPI00332AE60A